MPEVLQDGGVYFDPENADSIAGAIEKMITDRDLRIRMAKRARELSNHYSWQRCAGETWSFIRTIQHAETATVPASEQPVRHAAG